MRFPCGCVKSLLGREELRCPQNVEPCCAGVASRISWSTKVGGMVHGDGSEARGTALCQRTSQELDKFLAQKKTGRNSMRAGFGGFSRM